ncbi:spartin a isoform X2 [Thalassophryne amazonica]|uniref:spartin a isoform X2 n=1 Tax=Thalassophryne amazonica TaxID=390379 RepID=UPI0014725F9D|nr:spartin a isoform X2 [Thalassophryne amazonica]
MAEPAELLMIRDQYEVAFHSVSRGLTAEEAGRKDEAMECYRKGQQHLKQGVEVPTGGERQQGAAWDTARQLQQKMRDALNKVSAHLSDMETSEVKAGGQRLLLGLPSNFSTNPAAGSQAPHSYLHRLYPAVPNAAPPPNHTPPARPPPPVPVSTTHKPAEAAPGTMSKPADHPPVYTPQATDGHRNLASGHQGAVGTELLFIPSGVQMFFVAPNGQVSSLFHPSYLCIITFDDQHNGRPSSFLHVCNWMYPLTADTPVLLANSGIFMFPDTLAQTSGSYMGIVLSSRLPPRTRDMFEDLLSQLTELRIQGPTGELDSQIINLSEKVPLGPPLDQTGMAVPVGEKEKLLPGWSEKMAQGILTGTTRLSESFIKGAEATGRAVHRSGYKIRDHITPEETPSEVSPRVTKGLEVAKVATGGAVCFSRFLVNGMSAIMERVTDSVAPHVKKHGSKLIPESIKKTKDGKPSTVDGVKHVAATSVHGFSSVWSSLETGAKLVGKSVSAETVTTVKYKFRGLANLLNMSTKI